MIEITFKEVEEYIRSHPECADKVFKILGEVMDEWKAKCKKDRDLLADQAMLMMCGFVEDPEWTKGRNQGFKEASVKPIKELHFQNGITGHSVCEEKFYNKYIKPVFGD